MDLRFRKPLLYPAELQDQKKCGFRIDDHGLKKSEIIKSKIRSQTVGVAGFEPTTLCSQSRCASRTALHPDLFSFSYQPIFQTFQERDYLRDPWSPKQWIKSASRSGPASLHFRKTKQTCFSSVPCCCLIWSSSGERGIWTLGTPFEVRQFSKLLV